MTEPFAILHEDNHLLVVVKPPGMPTQRDASGDADLLTMLKAYVREKYHKPGAVYMGLVQRLDRPVGGVMVVARTSKAAARLSALVRERKLDKRYLAVARGEVPGPLELTDWLRKDERDGMVSVAPEGAPGAKLARLYSAPIATARDEAGEAYSLLDIRLITGRAHQIRVQHANAGYPLVGDRRYGAEAGLTGARANEIALWAAGIRFAHPTTREIMYFFAPPETRGHWRKFESVIATFAWEEWHE